MAVVVVQAGSWAVIVTRSGISSSQTLTLSPMMTNIHTPMTMTMALALDLVLVLLPCSCAVHACNCMHVLMSRVFISRTTTARLHRRRCLRGQMATIAIAVVVAIAISIVSSIGAFVIMRAASEVHGVLLWAGGGV